MGIYGSSDGSDSGLGPEMDAMLAMARERAARRPSQARDYSSEADVQRALQALDPRAAAIVQALLSQVAANPDSIPSRSALYDAYQAHLSRVLSEHPSHRGGVSMFDLLSFDAEFGEEVLRVFDSAVRYRASQELAAMRRSQASTGCALILALTAGVCGAATAGAIALLA
jgi:hypothetical protein